MPLRRSYVADGAVLGKKFRVVPPASFALAIVPGHAHSIAPGIIRIPLF